MQSPTRSFRRHRQWLVPAATILLAAYFGLHWAVAGRPPRLRKDGLDPEGARKLAASLAKPLRDAPKDPPALIALGNALLLDTNLGDGGKGCTTCHNPGAAFTGDNHVGPDRLRNTAGLLHLADRGPFGRTGEAPTLADFIVRHLESDEGLGTSRVALVRSIGRRFDAEWRLAYSDQVTIPQDLPSEGTPARPRPPVPSNTFMAVALATLGDGRLLKDLLETAQAHRRAPITELVERAFVSPLIANEWVAAWMALPPAIQTAVDRALTGAAAALAASIEALSTRDAPFDRFARRVAAGATIEAALDTRFGEEELVGLRLFEGPAGCARCHVGGDFTDNEFHNLGLPQVGTKIDLGRALWVEPPMGPDKDCADAATESSHSNAAPPCGADYHTAQLTLGAFRTPSLRNVALTAPYMHDGRFATLGEVIDSYDRPHVRPAVGYRDPLLDNQPMLTPEERAALVSFLNALTSTTPPGPRRAHQTTRMESKG